MAISKSQVFFEKLWYRNTVWWLWLFFPFHWLLKLLAWLRRSFYQLGFFKSSKLVVPVIVIGNINVGGTGKTPFAVYLLNYLKDQGHKPGLITRGYGSDTSLHPQLVEQQSQLNEVGDEPLLIFQNTQCPIIVDHQRSRGAQQLVDDYGCDIVVCDDGLQHYALQRDLEILIVDNSRGYGNGWLMPFGPLREPISRARHCDVKILNGKDMTLEASILKLVVDSSAITLDELKKPIHAVAGIGNPQRFFNSLKSLSVEFTEQSFPDHHNFQASDFTEQAGSIIMTEKDAVKCKAFADKRFYYLPVTAKLSPESQSILKQALNKLLD